MLLSFRLAHLAVTETSHTALLLYDAYILFYPSAHRPAAAAIG